MQHPSIPHIMQVWAGVSSLKTDSTTVFFTPSLTRFNTQVPARVQAWRPPERVEQCELRKAGQLWGGRHLKWWSQSDRLAAGQEPTIAWAEDKAWNCGDSGHPAWQGKACYFLYGWPGPLISPWAASTEGSPRSPPSTTPWCRLPYCCNSWCIRTPPFWRRGWTGPNVSYLA